MHYLVTGHTGFKGSWLSLILQMQGHTVSGISLDPLEKSLFNQANLGEIFENDFRIDIRNSKELTQAIVKIQPEVIIHLAAQPLVRESYKDPIGTFETNVIGTLNVLEATKHLSNLKATLIITTDKVYKNHNHLRGYEETDELGGDDPYSASKAAADIATQSWVKSFATTPVAIARAGNVIGGGDFSPNRLVPDCIKAINNNEYVEIRNPNSIRPWQHVLEPLYGYLLLAEKLYSNPKEFSGAWNFGPEPSNNKKVDYVTNYLHNKVYYNTANSVHEAKFLRLDSSKAKAHIGWWPKINLDEALDMCLKWNSS
jgi:CDP-glucose 4,6-dehydratase